MNRIARRLLQTQSEWGESLLLLLTRFALASVFWLSGQTKIEGFQLNLLSGQWHLGWPSLKDSTLVLFQHEYALPLLPYTVAAYLAATAEHVLPLLLLSGLTTRLAALGILVMTLVIEIFVYPDAYATHATWAALAILLMMKGGGYFSLDRVLSRRF